MEKSVERGYEGRMHLLSDKARGRMKSFVERKREEDEDRRIVDGDPDEAKADLAATLADLD